MLWYIHGLSDYRGLDCCVTIIFMQAVNYRLLGVFLSLKQEQMAKLDYWRPDYELLMRYPRKIDGVNDLIIGYK